MVQAFENSRNKIHPHKFLLYVAIVSISMMFAAFTSAYIVKQAQGNWLEYSFPIHFYFSTATIVISSFVLHRSFTAYNAGNEQRYKQFLLLGLGLGICFVVLQYFGWLALYEKGVDLKGNVSGSFFYLITFIHVLHVLGGIAALLLAVYHAFSLKFKVTASRR